MNQVEFKNRTKKFALRIIRLVESLGNIKTASVIGRQLLRSGTSVGANYRAACRARSRAEFVAKLGIVLEEADETVFWLELLQESEIVSARKLGPLVQEAAELTSIFVASICTAKGMASSKQGYFCIPTFAFSLLVTCFHHLDDGQGLPVAEGDRVVLNFDVAFRFVERDSAQSCAHFESHETGGSGRIFTGLEDHAADAATGEFRMDEEGADFGGIVRGVEQGVFATGVLVAAI